MSSSPAPQQPVAASLSRAPSSSTSASRNGGASPAATSAQAQSQPQAQSQSQQQRASAPAPPLPAELLSRTKDLKQSFMLFKITSDAMLSCPALPCPPPPSSSRLHRSFHCTRRKCFALLCFASPIMPFLVLHVQYSSDFYDLCSASNSRIQALAKQLKDETDRGNSSR